MGHKPYSDNYLMSLTKVQIIELLRVAENNLFATKEALNNSAKVGTKITEKYNRAKELLKLANYAIEYNMDKSCHTCKHFTSNRGCDIDKYLYGTGEKECEWEWKHMSEIINLLRD